MGTRQSRGHARLRSWQSTLSAERFPTFGAGHALIDDVGSGRNLPDLRDLRSDTAAANRSVNFDQYPRST